MGGRKTGLGIKIIAILTASIVIGIVLLVGVYALPVEEMKKNAQRKVELNRKQSTLLLSTVQKVKGDERAMLVQRVKEVQ